MCASPPEGLLTPALRNTPMQHPGTPQGAQGPVQGQTQVSNGTPRGQFFKMPLKYDHCKAGLRNGQSLSSILGPPELGRTGPKLPPVRKMTVCTLPGTPRGSCI